ncbi:MAG: glycosyltransferase family 39 protein [Caldilineales bacterium]|nr:glycosyltransferase family 39 protein [Caldilineales bacterium]MDW8316472.1 glycosyltransferase family 39 protein [Anaerolineae bacterium]
MDKPTARARSQATSTALPLILLLAAGLRFFRIGHQSLWADEGNTAAMAGRSLADISARAAADIHPPLYYWLVHLWARLFGDSEAALRSLSAVWGVALVWLVFQIGSRLHDRRTGLIAAFFAAVNPFLVYYSQEARMYAQLAALAALLFYGLVRFILHESVVLPADGSGRRISFSAPATATVLLATVAGLYTHYTFPALMAVATLLYVGWVINSRRRGFAKVRLLHWALLMMAAAFLFLPWLPTAFRQLTTWPAPQPSVDLGQALNTLLLTLALGPVAQVEASSGWTAVFLGLFILGLWPWVRANRRRAHWLSWALPLLWLAAPVALVLGAGLYKPAYLKFLVVAAAPLCLLMARGVTGFAEALARGLRPQAATPAEAQAAKAGARASRRGAPGNPRPAASSATAAQPGQSAGRWLSLGWTAAALALVTVPSALTLVAYYFDPTVARDDYRGMVRYIQAVAQPEDAIILNAPGQAEVFGYYYRGEWPVYGLPEQRPPDPAATVARLEELAGRHPHLYGLFWATEESDPQRIVEGWLDTHAYKAIDTWRGNVRLTMHATQRPTESWPVQTADVVLGEQIRLVRYALSAQEITSGEVLQLQLVWQAERQPDADYTVFVQLLDQRNQVAAQRDAPPVSGDRPTSGWQSGDLVVDNHGLLVLPATAPGDYLLIVGLYDPATGRRLASPAADYVRLGTVRVNRPASPPLPEALGMQNAASFRFDEITLLGHDRYKRGFRHNPAEPLRANDLLHLTFYWRADVKPTAAWWFTARLVTPSGREVAAVSGPLVSEQYPTLSWSEGEIVRGEHDLLLPAYLQPGRYQLQLFLHTGNPEAVIDRVNLGTVVISR